MTFLFYWSVFTLLGGFLQAKRKLTFTLHNQFSFRVLLFTTAIFSIPITIIHLFIASYWR